MRTTDFTKMLEIGLGRAVLYARQNDMTMYRDAILNACLHNLALDRQLEGSRAVYMMNVIEATGEIEYYRTRILESLVSLPDDADEYDVAQQYVLAELFAEQGDLQARQAIYNAFDAKPALDDFTGARVIVSLDGDAGLEYVADRLGGLIRVNGNEFPAGESIYSVDDRVLFWFGIDQDSDEDAVRDKLAQLPATPNLAAFLEATKKYEGAPDPKDKLEYVAGLDYTTLKQRIETFMLPHFDTYLSISARMTQWGKTASQADLDLAARDLALQPEVIAQTLYARIFASVPFPGDPAPLIRLAQSGDDRLAWAAIQALRHICHPVIRQFALDMIAANRRLGDVVVLLVENYEEGDWALIEEVTTRPLEREAYHHLGMHVEDVFKKHPSLDATGAFLNLYETVPCTHCRFRFIRALYKLDRLPDWIREECRYDSQADVRDAIDTEFAAPAQ